MAEVYLGLHKTLNRPVAVKILHGHLLEDDILTERFRSEAQAVANLRHPNIVQVFDFDIVEDRPYIVMELLEGPSLADYLGILRKRGETLPFSATGRIITGIAGALDYAHGRGIIHRDVKPSNVLLRTEAGPVDPTAPLPSDVQPILTDFGVARLANATIRTASGSIVGTPAYMSPEQISGTSVDARSDIYSLGVMVYEMLAGRLPFSSDEDTVASALLKHITEAPRPLPEVAPEIQAVVFRALAKDRGERYQKASEMALELRQALGVPLATREIDMLKASATYPTPAVLTASAVGLPQARSGSNRALWTIGIIALLIAALGIGILLGTDVLDDNQASSPPAASLSMDEMPEESFGVLGFDSDADERVNKAMLYVTGLTPPPDGSQYEAWLLGAETRRSIGILNVDRNGQGELGFTDAVSENLLTTFGRFEITIEPDPDSNPLPTGDGVYSGAIPSEPLLHIQHLLTAFDRTPDGGGLVTNLIHHAHLIHDAAAALSDAQKDDDLGQMKQQAEGLINLIEGVGGEHFGDLDGDGDVTNPGDGFGLLPGAENAGYIQSAIEHARYAAGTATATSNIMHQAEYLEIAAQNLGGWAAQLRDAALSIIESDSAAEAAPHVARMVELAGWFSDGNDANGSGKVEPIQGEGGADMVLYYALRMADIPVLEGMNRVPEPGAGVTPSAGHEESTHPAGEGNGEYSEGS